MILATSSYPEIFSAIEAEEEKIAYAIGKEEKKAIKTFEKSSKRYSLYYTKEYTVPSSRNRYLIWYFMPDADVVKPAFYWGAPLLLDEDNGKRIVIALSSMRAEGKGGSFNVDALQVYNGHFLSRYRERAGLPGEYTTAQVIATLMGNNASCMVQLDMEKMNPNYEKYKDAAVWQLTNGFSFGKQLVCESPSGKTFVVFEHKTYVSSDMLKQQQVDAAIPHEIVEMMMLRASLKYSDVIVGNPFDSHHGKLNSVEIRDSVIRNLNY